MCVARLFPKCPILRALFVFLLVLARAPSARAEAARVPPPRPELDLGPPPLPRAPEHARKTFELVAEVGAALPTCRSGPDAERCRALAPAFGAGLMALHRAFPYFAFGGAASYARASGRATAGSLDGVLLGAGAVGRVYLYEEGAFDPYLELELGYGSLRTSLVDHEDVRHEDRAFGPLARVAGGLDFIVLPALELGGALGFTHLLLERGERCAAEACVSGGAPSGAMLGALAFGLRAKLVLGAAH
jgi:hypothetical protein